MKCKSSQGLEYMYLITLSGMSDHICCLSPAVLTLTDSHNIQLLLTSCHHGGPELIRLQFLRLLLTHILSHFLFSPKMVRPLSESVYFL